MGGTDENIYFSGRRHGPLNLGLTISILVFFSLTGNATNLFLNHMDKTVDPCDDFYQYACGNFVKNAKIPNGLVTDQYGILQEETYEKLKQILEASVAEYDKKPLRISKKFYQTCMNSGNNDEKEEIVKNINSLGGWPSLNGVDGFKWNETQFDWQKMSRKLRQLGYLSHSFFKFSLYQDNTIIISPDRDEIFNGLNEFMQKRGVDKVVSDSDTLAVKQLKNKLDEVNSEGRYYHVTTVRGLQISNPEINWLEYIKTGGPFTVNENQTIYVRDLGYTSNLSKILAKEPKRVIANYILSKFAEIYTNYSTEVSKHRHSDRMSRSCIKSAQTKIPIAIYYVYANEYFLRQRSLLYIYPMLMELQYQYEKMFFELESGDIEMDLQFTNHARLKLNSIVNIMGSSRLLYNNTFVEEQLESLDLPENLHFEILSRIRKFNDDNSIKAKNDLNKDMNENILQINAFNIRSKNHFSILIPAAIIDGIFFGRNRPRYVNYGTMGKILGHEIGHTFDPERFLYDGDAKIQNYIKDTPLYTRYIQNANCLTEMLNNYTVKQINEKVNGEKTLNENFADLIGLKVAYEAWKEPPVKDGEDKRLPGIDKSAKQLFWLSVANSVCTRYDSKYLRETAMKNQHAPEEVRINIALKNIAAFGEDYQCPLGSKMNPVKKCPIF